MNIPMKYEDVVAKLDAALGREAALDKEAARYKSLFNQSEKALDRVHCMYGKRLLDLTGERQTILCPDEEFVKYFEELKDLKRENSALQQRLTVAEQRIVVLTEALEGMIEYFPEGHSDGECFSVERANLSLGRSNDCIHDWFPDYCLKCGITKP